MTPHIPVLLYHSVNATPPPGIEPFAVSPETFDAHIDAIERSGRRTLTVSELAAGLREPTELRGEVVVVTFDDGYADTLAAARRLASRGHRSTVYVTTSNIGTEWMLSDTDLRDLDDIEGVEIGAHARTHRRLDELGADELNDEIGASKKELECWLGHRVDSFAYPHGCYDRATRDVVVRCGYQSAAAVKNAMSHGGDDPFAIARWTVTAGTSADVLAARLRGEGVPSAWRRERLRTRAYRIVRRTRRRLQPTAAG